MDVVPAVLSETFDDFLLRLRQAKSFADYVQIDIMDGIFVPSKSFPAEMIKGIDTSLNFELHLMVKDPQALMERIENPHLKKVIFHFESEVRHLAFINQLRERRIIAGLAINPGTEIGKFRDVAEHVDTLLFLTVDPGWYGSSFKPEVLGKIERTRRIFRDKVIAVDGGISLENLELFYELGVDYVCVGSRIFLQDNPEKSFKKFTEKISELGIRKSGNSS